MIVLGTTLRCNLPPRHLWVVISDPRQTGGAILLVSLTTMRDGSVDDICTLGASDFPGYLTHVTTAAYSRAKAGSAEALSEAVANGSFTVVSPIPQPALTKIIDGARKSDELSANNKKLLPH